MYSRITEVGRANGKVYGVKIYVCGNAEVIANATVGSDPSGNGWKDEARSAVGAATSIILDARLDYELVSDFRAYNGGPRKGLVESAWFEAEVEVLELVDGTEEAVGEWSSAGDVPANLLAKVNAIIDEAGDALCGSMEAAAKSAN